MFHFYISYHAFVFFVFEYEHWIYIFFSCGANNQFGGTPTVKGLYQEDPPPSYPEFQEYILEESTNDDLSSYYKDRVVAFTLDYDNVTKKPRPVLWYSSQVNINIHSPNNSGTVNSPLIKTSFKVNRRDTKATTYVPLIE